MINRPVCALLLVAVLAMPARAAPLPPPGPPPDPSRGETYDGRPPERPTTARRLALAVPRALLLPPRFLLRAIRQPVLAAIAYTDRKDVARRQGGPSAPSRAGISPVARFGVGYAAAVGVRVWALDLWGPGVAASSLTFATGGKSYNEAAVKVRPNVALPVGVGLTVRGKRRTDQPFFGLAGEIPIDADGDTLKRRVDVGAADAELSLSMRPGGGAGSTRVTLGGGAGVRRFGEGDGGMPVDPLMAPGFHAGATFVRGRLTLERFGQFDASRSRPALDVAFSIEPTIGVGYGDVSRYVTLSTEAAYGVPVGEGRTIVVRGLLADQESVGAPPTFYDRLSLGGNTYHRGFDVRRFQGGSVALAALDYRWPILMWLDGFAFLDYGGAFGESFEGFQVAAMRPSLGMGFRLYWKDRFLLRTLVGWGIGDGVRFALTFDPGS